MVERGRRWTSGPRSRSEAGRAADRERSRRVREPEAARGLRPLDGQPHPRDAPLGALDRGTPDRLTRNVARYGGGVGAAPPPVDRFSDEELGAILSAARDEHYYPVILLLARTGLRIGEACGLRWRDMALRTSPPRLKVVWQLDKWGQIVDPKSPTSRRTIPLREEVVSELVRWRECQELWADRLGEQFVNEHGLAFTTKTGRPISKRNIARSFERARKAACVEHGTLKTLRSTVATQLAEGGLHPRKAQTFLSCPAVWRSVTVVRRLHGCHVWSGAGTTPL